MSREGDVVVALCSIDELLDTLRFSKSLYIAWNPDFCFAFFFFASFAIVRLQVLLP